MNTKFDAGLTDPTKISVHQTAEPAQPVAEFHAHPADWQYNITLLPGVPMLLDGTKLYLAPQPPADVPPMTDEDFVKIAFPYLDGALMEEIEMDGYALLEILRAVEAEVRRGCGVVG